jgi:sugar lactone lactonase YvrE
MSRSLSLSAFLAACTSSSPTTPPAPAPSPALPIIVEGLASPESATHDPAADVYLVSNIDGSPFEADHRGHVSRIAPDGRVVAARWLDGLDAPKGVAVGGDLVAVADLGVLRRFDRRSGAPVDAIAIPDATFLNGVEPDGDGGAFFVTDSGMKGVAEPPGMAPTGSDAIHRVARDGTVTTVARGAELAMPNGLAAAGDTLYMVGFGGRAVVPFDRAGTRGAPIELGAGYLDGLVAAGDGCIYVSSLEASAILAGRAGGTFAPVTRDVIAADVGLDGVRGRLLLPLLTENRLQIIALPPCPAE